MYSYLFIMISRAINILKVFTLSSFIKKSLLGSLLIAVASQISVPLFPVPMTLQTLALALIGLLCSPSVAVSSVLLYLLMAITGLPVLSGFVGGMSALFGFTTGYVIGFFPMVLIISFLCKFNNAIMGRVVACGVGFSVLFFCGVTWLSFSLGLKQALQFGLYPFLLKIPVTIIVAVAFSLLVKKKRR